jgi:exonuclease III
VLRLQIHVQPDPLIVVASCGSGYQDFWSCSTTKKGYAGTAVFIRGQATAVDATRYDVVPYVDGPGRCRRSRLPLVHRSQRLGAAIY